MIPFLIPIISAFIGWFTNYIAIKMLFHPREPKTILGLTFHGIFPKRQKQFASKLGATVSNELLHFDEIAAQLQDPEQLKKLSPVIELHIDHFLDVKLKEKLPIVSMFASKDMKASIKTGLMEEIEILLPELIGKYTGQMGKNIDIEKMVTEKVENFSSDKLEEILFQIMKKEFKFVELIGAVLGFIIGLFQVLLTQFV